MMDDPNGRPMSRFAATPKEIFARTAKNMEIRKRGRKGLSTKAVREGKKAAHDMLQAPRPLPALSS